MSERVELKVGMKMCDDCLFIFKGSKETPCPCCGYIHGHVRRMEQEG